ncbi:MULTISPECIES: NADH-quinone oxidoreductase subunit N [Thermodesulfovibrio]|uniref:NADH-quinone oxidoreductase subunit N 2 n=1 Tax=Thermodesulfovibrio yellowstonii (strain ATCC 51303 / DSM 11347 / YP87) TaxID=289376 RepID=NUON2_THEYD|nr:MULTISPECIES: NADH-quinone oxidoreductase subunit N [Thermodesulfovibrio]B5YL23.1 RecName: Full=NADH-quinone oxidoreductase subunit N 2; AltName: Full=NADH dehydrogenase I subunit N 2; AltName: Full=NDH-1 subunit N 2 [Thermodesulfovibrio yellowstonii DSM 11347]ACI21900.1 NAD(P)H-quinone oxidoreductase chain 2, (NAD(P)H dehydrogenase, chain 2) [Thermodesulfovibrio yellowstonii DSM 11347]MDI6864123.1 NADH-quinone oxidoreductase subunit N [Thermodesulfovibrio yellowstonii]
MIQYKVLIPEISLLILAIISFFYGFISRNYRTTYILSFLSILTAIILSVFNFGQKEFTSELIKIDLYRQTLRILVLFIGVFIIGLSYSDLKLKSSKSVEYVFLLLLSLFGMNLMIVANDLLILYLALETFSLSLYILAGFYRKESLSIEAGMKYFILGTLSSIILLGSIVFFYAQTGSTSYETFKLLKTENLNILLGVVFLISAFAFKLSLAPFHAWAPDVYQGAPTAVTAFLSTAPKVAVFGALINIFLSINLKLNIQDLIVIISALSMLVGNVLALRQNNLKRMLAYSSIAHAGYMFMAFLLPEKELLISLIPYLIVYVFMNLSAFAFIMNIKNGESIQNYLGVGRKNPLLSFCIIVIMFSLTGVPPTAGFIVKFNLFKNLLSYGYGSLVFFALLMSIFSAFYYLRPVFYLYKDSLVIDIYNHPLNNSMALSGALLLIFLGLFPNLLLIF